MSLPATRPTRVLIVRVGAMGDILHGLPAVGALRAALPDVHIGWAVEPRWQALLGEPVIDRLHEVPTRDWKERPFSLRTGRQIRALRAELRAAQYDVCVDLQGSIRSAVIGRMSGARRFIGPETPREKAARWLYRERVRLQAPDVIRQACELVSVAAGRILGPAAVEIPSTAAAEAWARQFGSGFALIAPTAGWGAKEWGAERYRSLVERLLAAGRKVLVTGLPGDLTVAHVVQDTEAVSVCCSLAELVALTRRAGLVVGGDTGPVHLAAALGVPVVALFGPTDPVRNGPHFPGATVRILRHPDSRVSYKRNAETDPGLAQVSVDEVYQAAVELLGIGI